MLIDIIAEHMGWDSYCSDGRAQGRILKEQWLLSCCGTIPSVAPLGIIGCTLDNAAIIYDNRYYISQIWSLTYFLPSSYNN